MSSCSVLRDRKTRVVQASHGPKGLVIAAEMRSAVSAHLLTRGWGSHHVSCGRRKTRTGSVCTTPDEDADPLKPPFLEAAAMEGNFCHERRHRASSVSVCMTPACSRATAWANTGVAKKGLIPWQSIPFPCGTLSQRRGVALPLPEELDERVERVSDDDHARDLDTVSSAAKAATSVGSPSSVTAP